MLWNIEIYTPFTGGTAMLLHINRKLKSSLCREQYSQESDVEM